jgi:hypothetical protein
MDFEIQFQSKKKKDYNSITKKFTKNNKNGWIQLKTHIGAHRRKIQGENQWGFWQTFCEGSMGLEKNSMEGTSFGVGQIRSGKVRLGQVRLG